MGSGDAATLLAQARRRTGSGLALDKPVRLTRGRDRYTLTHRIGSGNTGQVFRATDGEGRPWALKKAIDDNARQRQREEARRAEQLQHPNVLRVYDVIEGPEAQYLRMDLIEGCTLAEWLAEHGRPPLDAALRWCADAAAGLAHAHEAGIVHRDLKPSNAMIGPDMRLRLIDFGLAKGATSADLTQTGAGLGTLKYQAPEVFAASHLHDVVTDVFALGLLMAETLGGAHVLPPAVWELPRVELLAGAKRAYAALDWRAPAEVPEAVADVVRRCLAVPRGERPSAADIRGALEWVVEQREAARRRAEAQRHAAARAAEAAERVARQQAAGRSEVGAVDVGPLSPPGAPSSPRGTSWAWGLVVLAGAGVAWVGRGWLNPTAVATVLPPVEIPSAPATAAPSAPPRAVTVPEGMVHVPAGPFWRGCAKDPVACYPDERGPPWQGEVVVPGFFIDRTEVTVADYAACVAANKCNADGVSSSTGEEWSQWCTWRRSGGGKKVGLSDHPMTCVTFEQAQRYCASKGRRLPNEQEWEKAARGPSGAKYGWTGDVAYGAEGRRRANVCDANCLKKWPDWTGVAGYDDGYQVTAPVASYGLGASPYGAYDMIGNVWEWVEWVDGLALNPAERGLRGGSWLGSSEDARASNRFGFDPTFRDGNVGFRCAQSE